MIADAAQREQALNPVHSFIVQAPAGSGKTELLIQRYLKLLSLVDAPEEIVAITFTKKAAAEMQERILKALNKAHQGNKPEIEHERHTFELASNALERDQSLQWNIIANPNRLKIQTIDSLCASLSQQMPVLSRLGSSVETSEQTLLLFEEAISNVLSRLESDEWSEDIANLLIYLDNDLPRLKKLLIEMLMKRDQWMRTIMYEYEREDIEQTLQSIVQQHLTLLSHHFPKQYETELCELLRYATTHLLNDNPKNASTVCDGITKLPDNTWQQLEIWKAIRHFLLTTSKPYDWRKQTNKNIGFPAPSENKAESAERKAMKNKMQALLKSLQDYPQCKQYLLELDELSTHYNEDDWLIIGSMIRLLTLAEAELRLVFAKTNKLDFIAVSQAAITALGHDEEPTDLALYLDYKINHLLIDEFQDISFSQYELIHRLIAGWSLEDGRSLFLVGDPMQSIYRFREAEVGLFIQTWELQRLNQVKLQTLRLQSNFRSNKVIVDWVNERFSEIMPDEVDINRGAVRYSPSVAFHQQGHKDDIIFHALLNKADVEEADLIVSDIRSILESTDDDSIAILVKGRSHLSHIIPALKNADIAFRAVDIHRLDNQSHIQDVFSITRAYSHLADRIAWLAVLRAPYCGLSMRSLQILFSDTQGEIVWDIIQKNDKINLLEENERSRLLRLVEIFKQQFQFKQRRSLHRAVESLWLTLLGPAALTHSYQLEDVARYFDLLDEYDDCGELANVSELESAIANLYANSNTDDSVRVQIMSMHKSKGLEFDHVFLPGLGKKPRVSTDDLLKWSSVTDTQQQRLLIAPIRESGNKASDLYNYLKTQEKIKQRYENVRLLYVATTRAKKSLRLYGHAQVKEKEDETSCHVDSNSLLHYLWSYSEPFFLKALEGRETNESQQEMIYIDQRLRRLKQFDNIPPKNALPISTIQSAVDDRTAEIEYEWASENIQHIGTTVHRYLQEIGEQGLMDWTQERIEKHVDKFKSYLRLLGVDKKDLHWASRRVTAALLNTVSDQRGQWIFSHEHTHVDDELALTGLFNQSVVNIKIDRTFVDKHNVRWIIDYKTSRHDDADVEEFLDQEKIRYQEQLERYASIMKQMNETESNRKICLGLYFPLLTGWREWPA